MRPEPGLVRVVIDLAGPICQDCAAVLTAVLLVMPGVRHVEVPRSADYAVVRVRRDGASEFELRTASRRAGFSLRDRSPRSRRVGGVLDRGLPSAIRPTPRPHLN